MATLTRAPSGFAAGGAAAEAPWVLEADGLHLGHPDRDGRTRLVIAGLSLRVAAGETVAILGPSGVGKSSLLRVLAGLDQPQRGQVRVHGAPLSGPHPRLSFVFQDPCLLPWLTLEANVGFGLDFRNQPKLPRDERKRRVDAAIAEVDLEPARSAWPSELSGGMKQRAALARAVAREPDILLLDEPFSALDEITRGEMQALVRGIIRRHQTAAILVTHDIDEALLLADRIVLLGGRPADATGEWAVDLPHPRGETSAEHNRLRLDIVRLLHQARAALSAPATTRSSLVEVHHVP